MSFIQKWKNENNDNLKLYHEIPIDDLYIRFELPYINHDACPRDKKHLGVVVDGGGKVRCGQKSIKKFKPSFMYRYDSFDELSQMKVKEFCEEKPCDPYYEDDWGEMVYPEEEWSKYLKAMDKYNSEEKTVEVVDVCYAIISDKNLVLPFETILRRLNLAPERRTVYCKNSFDINGKCRRVDELDRFDKRKYEDTGICLGHNDAVKEVVFPFDGWDLAHYLQRWREQVPGAKAPWFAEKQERLTSTPIPCYD